MTSASNWVSRVAFDTRRRRMAYAAAGLVLAILCVFPRPYVARAKLLPQDASSAGLGQVLNSLGGQISTFANLLTGGRTPNDLYLIIGRSDKVTSDVVRALKLAGPGQQYATTDDAKIALGKRVDVNLLLGGVVQVETKSHDPQQAARITDAFVTAISRNVAALSRTTAQSKQRIVKARFVDAGNRVSQSAAALAQFREQNHLADPEIQFGSQLSLRAGLEGQLQAKEVEVQSARQFAGPDNPQFVQLQAEASALRAQLAQASRPTAGPTGANAFGLSTIFAKYLDLYRNYKFSQSLYEVYARASEQVAVEDLVANDATYIQIVEPTHLDPERQYNNWAVGLLVTLILFALLTEVYAPATGLRLPGREGHGDNLE